MGANVSVESCKTMHQVDVNCTLVGPFNETTQEWSVSPPYTSIGGFERGQVPGDPDVAGKLILITYICVTAAAILFSILLLLMHVHRRFFIDRTRTEEEKAADSQHTHFLEEIFETFVLFCSDQQIFTGAAYGIAMRYYRQCVVTAYHYDMISAMMLISCATHVVAVAAVRQYWRHKVLAFVRVICVGLFILMTTMFMMNQNAHSLLKFPTTLSGDDAHDSRIFLPAACFQSSDSAVLSTLQASTESMDAFITSLKDQTPGWNQIQGWRSFFFIMCYYVLSLVTAVGRLLRWCFRKGSRARQDKIETYLEHPGLKGKFFRLLRILRHWYYCSFLAIGLAVAIYTTYTTAKYLYHLRLWAHESGWMVNPNDEDEATSFGQLVPALSCGYIVFGLFQVVSERVVGRRERRKLKKRYSSYEYLSQHGPPSAKLIPTEYYAGSPDMKSGKSRDSGYFPLMAVTPGSRTSENITGSVAASKWPSQHGTPRTSTYTLIDLHGTSPGIMSPPPPTGRSVSYASVRSDSRPGSTLIGSDVGMVPSAETDKGDVEQSRLRTKSEPTRVSPESL